MNLDAIFAGGLMGTVVAGVITLLQVLFNKKLRSPADNQAQRDAAIAERNQIVATLREDVKTLRDNLGKLEVRLEKVEDENDLLKAAALARDHYIYRCINVIMKLGGTIPAPLPEGIRP